MNLRYIYIYVYCTVKCLCTSILHRHSVLLLEKELDCSSPQPKRLLLPPLTSDYLDPRHVKFQHVMATFDWGPKWSKWIQMDPRKTPSATVSNLMWGGKFETPCSGLFKHEFRFCSDVWCLKVSQCWICSKPLLFRLNNLWSKSGLRWLKDGIILIYTNIILIYLISIIILILSH